MIVGIAGRKHSGKSTIGKYLVDIYGFLPYMIADPFKEAAKALFGWEDSYFESSFLKEVVDPKWGISPREALKYLGDEFLRDLGKHNSAFAAVTGANLYINRMRDFICNNMDKNIVITDIRRPSEVEILRNYNSIILRVTRSSNNSIKDTHSSESLVDSLFVDGNIMNDGSLEELYQNVLKHI